MDRDTAVAMAQQAIRDKNKRLIDAVLAIKAERDQNPQEKPPVDERPLIGVTVSA